MRRNPAKLATAALLAAMNCPAVAAVYEVGDEGALERLDTPAAPPAAVTAPRHRGTDTAEARQRSASYQPYVANAARRYGVSPVLIDAIAHTESRYRPGAVSRAGAVGIMQLMPGTARQLGVDSRDPAANIAGGTAYLRQMLDRFDGDVVRAVAAYNAGPGAVSRAKGIPNYPETVSYVGKVLDRMADAANEPVKRRLEGH